MHFLPRKERMSDVYVGELDYVMLWFFKVITNIYDETGVMR
jgi:hypothetical protein